jgi:hypothetical protein
MVLASMDEKGWHRSVLHLVQRLHMIHVEVG